VPERCEMLGDQGAGGIIRGTRGCLISEVSLRIGCHSSAPSRATTAPNNWFITSLCNQDDVRRRCAAFSAFCSLRRLGCGVPIE
jgi:hypothetical protein